MRQLTEVEGDALYKIWQAKKKFAFTNPDDVYPEQHAFFSDGFTAGLDFQAQRVAELEARIAEIRFQYDGIMEWAKYSKKPIVTTGLACAITGQSLEELTNA